MNDCEVPVQSRESIVEGMNWQREEQLIELKAFRHKHQRLMKARWNPVTAAVTDVGDAVFDEKLREIEELDEPHILSDGDVAIIDALLEELNLVNAHQERSERSVVPEVEKVTVHGNGVQKVSVEVTCDVT